MRAVVELKLIACAAAWAACAACGGSQPADSSNTTVTVERSQEPASTEPDLEESRASVERMGALFAQLGDSVDAAGSDCDKVAANITAWTNTHRSELRSLNDKLAAMPRAHVDSFAPRLESTLRRAALQLKDGSDRCVGHAGVFEAKSGLKL